jgi:hypothetical protein
MTLPEPVPGLVIRYSYVWRREADKGEESGRKQRPCAVILTVQRENGETIAYVAPLTHSAPKEQWEAIALSGAVRRRLGLDDLPSWVVTTEFNAFRWPGADLAMLPEDLAPGEVAYGSLPSILVDRITLQFRENTARGRVRAVKRTE